MPANAISYVVTEYFTAGRCLDRAVAHGRLRREFASCFRMVSSNGIANASPALPVVAARSETVRWNRAALGTTAHDREQQRRKNI